MGRIGAAQTERPPRGRTLRPAEQAAIPALYAWCVTVAPVAWQSSAVSLVPAVLALVSQGAAIALERRRETRNERPKPMNEMGENAPVSLSSPSAFSAPYQQYGSRFSGALSVWGFSGMSALVWVLASARALHSFDVARGLSGCAGWMLFAFTACAPVIPQKSNDPEPHTNSVRLGPSGRLEAALMLVSCAGVLLLQGIGWSTREPERGVFLRLLAVALSMGWLGASTVFVAERYGKEKRQGQTRALVPLLYMAMAVVLASFAYLR